MKLPRTSPMWRATLCSRELLGVAIHRRRTLAEHREWRRVARAAISFRRALKAKPLRPTAPSIYNIVMRHYWRIDLHVVTSSVTAAMPPRSSSRQQLITVRSVPVLPSLRLGLRLQSQQYSTPTTGLASRSEVAGLQVAVREPKLAPSHGALILRHLAYSMHRELNTTTLSKQVRRREVIRTFVSMRGQTLLEHVARTRLLRMSQSVERRELIEPTPVTRLLRRVSHATRDAMNEPTVHVQRQVRPTTLTWRKSAGGSGESSAQRFTAAATSAARELSAASMPAQHASASVPRTQIVNEHQPTQLSRATIDRLADDVMQRLERRIRVERERRGL